jgi:putative FmdB family regulatory protein
MPAQEYGCNHCNITFEQPKSDNPKDNENLKCPGCGSSDVEKFDSLADKFKFFTRFAFSGG